MSIIGVQKKIRCRDCDRWYRVDAGARSVHRCRNPGSYERAMVACQAMSRFMVWVWMELEVKAVPVKIRLHEDWERALVFKRAIDRGLLRIDWGRR